METHLFNYEGELYSRCAMRAGFDTERLGERSLHLETSITLQQKLVIPHPSSGSWLIIERKRKKILMCISRNEVDCQSHHSRSSLRVLFIWKLPVPILHSKGFLDETRRKQQCCQWLYRVDLLMSRDDHSLLHTLVFQIKAFQKLELQRGYFHTEVQQHDCVFVINLLAYTYVRFTCTGRRGEGRREPSYAPLGAKGLPLRSGVILRIAPLLKGDPLAPKGVELRSLSSKLSYHHIPEKCKLCSFWLEGFRVPIKHANTLGVTRLALWNSQMRFTCIGRRGEGRRA